MFFTFEAIYQITLSSPFLHFFFGDPILFFGVLLPPLQGGESINTSITAFLNF